MRIKKQVMVTRTSKTLLQLAQEVIQTLRRRSEALALAESCTGGLVSSALVQVPNASNVWQGSIVCYANSAKVDLLKISAKLLKKYGAVSEPVALKMAHGAKKYLKADWGVGITGIAGPSGGSIEKPVGLVFIALVGPEVEEVLRCRFKGSRAAVQKGATKKALEVLLANLK